MGIGRLVKWSFVNWSQGLQCHRQIVLPGLHVLHILVFLVVDRERIEYIH
jgi:hypothetical protein